MIIYVVYMVAGYSGSQSACKAAAESCKASIDAGVGFIEASLAIDDPSGDTGQDPGPANRGWAVQLRDDFSEHIPQGAPSPVTSLPEDTSVEPARPWGSPSGGGP
jgi:hypothetical protein